MGFAASSTSLLSHVPLQERQTTPIFLDPPKSLHAVVDHDGYYSQISALQRVQHLTTSTIFKRDAFFFTAMPVTHLDGYYFAIATNREAHVITP